MNWSPVGLSCIQENVIVLVFPGFYKYLAQILWDIVIFYAQVHMIVLLFHLFRETFSRNPFHISRAGCSGKRYSSERRLGAQVGFVEGKQCDFLRRVSPGNVITFTRKQREKKITDSIAGSDQVRILSVVVDKLRTVFKMSSISSVCNLFAAG